MGLEGRTALTAEKFILKATESSRSLSVWRVVARVAFFIKW